MPHGFYLPISPLLLDSFIRRQADRLFCLRCVAHECHARLEADRLAVPGPQDVQQHRSPLVFRGAHGWDRRDVYRVAQDPLT